MPKGKIARIRTIEGWPAAPIEARQTAGTSVGITLDRELFVERGDVIGHVGQSPRETRRIHARIFLAGAFVHLHLGCSLVHAGLVLRGILGEGRERHDNDERSERDLFHANTMLVENSGGTARNGRHLF